MKAEEIARKIVFEATGGYVPPDVIAMGTEMIRQAEAAARAEEREACAVVSEDDGTPAGKHIAMMIRARND